MPRPLGVYLVDVDAHIRIHPELLKACYRKNIANKTQVDKLLSIWYSYERIPSPSVACAEQNGSSTTYNSSSLLPEKLLEYICLRTSRVKKMIWPHHDELSRAYAQIGRFLLERLAQPRINGERNFIAAYTNLFHLLMPSKWDTREHGDFASFAMQLMSNDDDEWDMLAFLDDMFEEIQQTFISNHHSRSLDAEFEVNTSTIVDFVQSVFYAEYRFQDFPYKSFFNEFIEELLSTPDRNPISFIEFVTRCGHTRGKMFRSDCDSLLHTMNIMVKARVLLSSYPYLIRSFASLLSGIQSDLSTPCSSCNDVNAYRIVRARIIAWYKLLVHRDAGIAIPVQQILHFSIQLVCFNIDYAIRIMRSLHAPESVAKIFETIQDVYIPALRCVATHVDKQQQHGVSTRPPLISPIHPSIVTPNLRNYHSETTKLLGTLLSATMPTASITVITARSGGELSNIRFDAVQFQRYLRMASVVAIAIVAKPVPQAYLTKVPIALSAIRSRLSRWEDRCVRSIFSAHFVHMSSAGFVSRYLEINSKHAEILRLSFNERRVERSTNGKVARLMSRGTIDRVYKNLSLEVERSHSLSLCQHTRFEIDEVAFFKHIVSQINDMNDQHTHAPMHLYECTITSHAIKRFLLDHFLRASLKQQSRLLLPIDSYKNEKSTSISSRRRWVLARCIHLREFIESVFPQDFMQETIIADWFKDNGLALRAAALAKASNLRMLQYHFNHKCDGWISSCPSWDLFADRVQCSDASPTFMLMFMFSEWNMGADWSAHLNKPSFLSLCDKQFVPTCNCANEEMPADIGKTSELLDMQSTLTGVAQQIYQFENTQCTASGSSCVSKRHLARFILFQAVRMWWDDHKSGAPQIRGAVGWMILGICLLKYHSDSAQRYQSVFARKELMETWCSWFSNDVTVPLTDMELLRNIYELRGIDESESHLRASEYLNQDVPHHACARIAMDVHIGLTKENRSCEILMEPAISMEDNDQTKTLVDEKDETNCIDEAPEDLGDEIVLCTPANVAYPDGDRVQWVESQSSMESNDHEHTQEGANHETTVALYPADDVALHEGVEDIPSMTTGDSTTNSNATLPCTDKIMSLIDNMAMLSAKMKMI